MKYKAARITALSSLLTALIFLAGTPALSQGQDKAMQEEIQQLKEQGKAMQEEIQRLKEQGKVMQEEMVRVRGEQKEIKGEQMDLKKEATAAAAASPTFVYRPRRGYLIEAADRSWGVRSFARLHTRLMFWPDDDAVSGRRKGRFSQGDIALRRWRWGFNPQLADGFYQLDFEMDGEPDRQIQIQKGEFEFHFEQLNPYLPTLIGGLRTSAFFNRHDTNWGSATGGLFDRSMFQDGAGIGAGSQNNAVGLFWDDVPIGPGVLLFQGIYSNQGLLNVGDKERPDSDNRSGHFAINIQPFSKTKNRWIEGLDFGVAYHFDSLENAEDEDGANFSRNFFRVRTTERQRLRLIEVNRDLEGTRHYITPGFGWRIGPYWLRVAGGFQQGHFTSGAGQEGGLVRGNMWRIGQELWLWSPKGFLTGSNATAGSLMFFNGFERNDYKAPTGVGGGLRDCSSVTLNGECKGAYAYNANAGLWYIVRPGIRVGLEYGFYSVNKIGRGGDSIVRIGDKSGRGVDFNTLEFGVTFDY